MSGGGGDMYTVHWCFRGGGLVFTVVTVSRGGGGSGEFCIGDCIYKAKCKGFFYSGGLEGRWFAPGVCGGRYSQLCVAVLGGGGMDTVWYSSGDVAGQRDGLVSQWRGTVGAKVRNNSQFQY